MAKTSKVIVDTNVIAVANKKAEQASPDCVKACISQLQIIKDQLIVVVDNHYLILKEYRRYANAAGKPGVGDDFFRWVWDNRANNRHCEMVRIHPLNEACDEFEEFPQNAELQQKFDRADRKFVATCVAAFKEPVILNAVDSDWGDCQAALEAEGIRVENLCQCP